MALFKKGCSPGPGRPRMSPEMREVKKLSKTFVDKVMLNFLRLTDEELRSVSKHRDTTQMEQIIIGIIMRAKIEGDYNRFNFFLNRLVGKAGNAIQEPDTERFKFVIEKVNGDQEILKIDKT